MNKINIVYFVWGHTDSIAIYQGSLLRQSILSVKKHIENAKIFVYLGDRARFHAQEKFWEKHQVSILPQTRKRLGYFNKLDFFSVAIEDLDHFIFLDTDTLVKRYPHKLLDIKSPLLFAIPYTSKRRELRKTWKSQVKFLSKFGVKKPFLYPNTSVIKVDQSDSVFWEKYKKSLNTIIQEFLKKVDKRKYTNHLNKGRYNDELYFALALNRCNLKILNHVVPIKVSRSWLKHGCKLI